MNSETILSSVDDLYEFEYYMYSYPEKSGILILKLDFRAWYRGRGAALVCYFTEVGTMRRIRLTAWKKTIDREIYAPKNDETNFRDVENGTFWKCVLEYTRTGRVKWTKAFPLEREEAIKLGTFET